VAICESAQWNNQWANHAGCRQNAAFRISKVIKMETGKATQIKRTDDEGEHVDVCIGAPTAQLGAKAHAPVAGDDK
jgi:hypothetical protein